jgi:TonB family protein
LVAVLLAISRYWPQRPEVIERPAFTQADVIYYSPSEYLPPLNSGGKHMQLPQKGDPAYAPQPIISVPAEPDNRRQTIVTPPQVKLNREVALPNIVAWTETPQPQLPLAATAGVTADRKLPQLLAVAVVAPPPELSKVTANERPRLEQTAVAPSPQIQTARSGRMLGGPQALVVEPPPLVRAALTRRLGDITIGQSQVIAPAPLLPLEAQRTVSRGGAVGALGAAAPVPPAPALQGGPSLSRGVGVAGGLGSARAVPPPPPVEGTGGGVARNGGQLIALSIHPAPPNGAVEVPAGNRRGTFAATAQGSASAAGTPDIAAASGRTGAGSGSQGKGGGSGAATTGVPAGIFVGAAPPPNHSSATSGRGSGSGGGSGNSSAPSGTTLTADATPPRVTSNGRPAREAADPTPADQQVFGGRRFYSMTLNMPNLNSALGSWVFHFAELKSAETKGDLMAPEILQKVDPAYPLELMRRNVHGTVTLYAVIHSDGHVGEVKVLEGIDDRLDSYAQTALSQWRFQPATKNGKAVALEAVVMIPFRAARKSGF